MGKFTGKPINLMVKTHGFPVKFFPNKPIHGYGKTHHFFMGKVSRSRPDLQALGAFLHLGDALAAETLCLAGFEAGCSPVLRPSTVGGLMITRPGKHTKSYGIDGP